MSHSKVLLGERQQNILKILEKEVPFPLRSWRRCFPSVE